MHHYLQNITAKITTIPTPLNLHKLETKQTLIVTIYQLLCNGKDVLLIPNIISYQLFDNDRRVLSYIKEVVTYLQSLSFTKFVTDNNLYVELISMYFMNHSQYILLAKVNNE